MDGTLIKFMGRKEHGHPFNPVRAWPAVFLSILATVVLYSDLWKYDGGGSIVCICDKVVKLIRASVVAVIYIEFFSELLFVISLSFSTCPHCAISK